jgi:hypothetical protein
MSGALNLDGSNLGGGPFNGFSPLQTINNTKDSAQVMHRRVVRNAWNTPYATGNFNNKHRVTTPFRAVNNLGDFLERKNYVCGGPSPLNASRPGWKGHLGSMISRCDGTGVPSSTCNVKFVADSSDYITYRKLRATNHTYNDLKNGGDEHNASYVDVMRVRRL